MSGEVPYLEVRDLRVTRSGAVILAIDRLTLDAGEVLALIGPNGAGKSTLLLSLMGLDRSVPGTVLFQGLPIEPGPEALAYRRRIAMVFQEPLLFKTTVFENVAAGLKIRGLKRAEIERRVAMNLERFKIGHLRDRKAQSLSGGEAQRTSLARALATEPEILLLDEPFAALDPPTREALMGDLERTLRETRVTTMIATHDRLEAVRLADRMAVMRAGRIVQIGHPEEVMNHPVDEFTATFVGVETILPGTVLRNERGVLTVALAGGGMEAVGDHAVGDAVALCIRPEHVTLSPQSSHRETSARNVHPGRVVAIVRHGPYHLVSLDCGFPLTAAVTLASAEELALAPGAEILAACKATAVHVIRRR